MIKTEQNIIAKIETCASARNFMAVVTELILRDFAGTIENLGKARLKEALNYSSVACVFTGLLNNATQYATSSSNPYLCPATRSSTDQHNQEDDLTRSGNKIGTAWP